MARSTRTVSPQSFRSSLSSVLTFMVLAWSPADLTASFQLGKHCETEYSEIPASPTNSERVGARPSPLAMAAMEFRICCLSDIGSLLLPCFSTPLEGNHRPKGRPLQRVVVRAETSKRG